MDKTLQSRVKSRMEAQQNVIPEASATAQTPGPDEEQQESSVMDHMRTRVRRMAPKVAMMKRKNAPPILSLPGEDSREDETE